MYIRQQPCQITVLTSQAYPAQSPEFLTLDLWKPHWVTSGVGPWDEDSVFMSNGLRQVLCNGESDVPGRFMTIMPVPSNYILVPYSLTMSLTLVLLG